MKVSVPVLPVLGLVLLGLVAAGCAAPGDGGSSGDGWGLRSTKDPAGYRGNLLDNPYTMPELTLTDTAGKPFDLVADTRKPLTLIFFGYTHCPDVCNLVLAEVASAKRRVDSGLREDIQLVFITADPERDTPEVIREYLDRFDPSFEGLTAPMPVIEQVAARLGVSLTGKSKVTDGSYEVGHTAQVIGFDDDDKGWIVWTPETPVGDLRRDYERYLEQARS